MLFTTFHLEASLLIDRVVKNNIYLNREKVIDWQRNPDILGKIKIEAGDEIHDLLIKFNLEPDLDEIDEMIEACVKMATLTN